MLTLVRDRDMDPPRLDRFDLHDPLPAMMCGEIRPAAGERKGSALLWRLGSRFFRRFAVPFDQTDAQRLQRGVGDPREACLAVAQRPDGAALGEPALVDGIEALADLRRRADGKPGQCQLPAARAGV